MTKKARHGKSLTKKEAQRFLEAEESLRRMQEEIAPFMKRREFKQSSTAGEWCETSNLYSQIQ